ncbi:hypothetical protein [Streptomyces xylophagus]|nr:hypothetical protein [Streptomyces xylophagus]
MSLGQYLARDDLPLQPDLGGFQRRSRAGRFQLPPTAITFG